MFLGQERGTGQVIFKNILTFYFVHLVIIEVFYEHEIAIIFYSISYFDQGTNGINTK